MPRSSSRRKTSLFYPPHPSLPLIWLLQKTLPTIAHSVYQFDLIVTPQSLPHLETLRRKPCLLLCNHPSFHDPIVMFLLSIRMGKPFYYLSAYEQFKGLNGWLYQHLGAYSIRRGLPDRDSMIQTIQLMMQPDCKLVIFPEGGCSFQNDTIMPFRPGAIQMGFQAIAKQVKAGNPLSDFYVAPISLKYRYTGNMIPAIDETFRKLEQHFHLPSKGDFYERLRSVASCVLVRCEQEYGITPPAHADWNQRIDELKKHSIDHCEARLGITSSVGEPYRERVYRIRHTMEHRSVTILPDGTDGWDIMAKAMMRVLNFDAAYDGYVASKPTPERFLDTLVRLEREVFEIDQPPPKGHRLANLRIAEPINLKNYYQAYVGDRSGTIRALTEQIQATMQKNLDFLSEGFLL